MRRTVTLTNWLAGQAKLSVDRIGDRVFLTVQTDKGEHTFNLSVDDWHYLGRDIDG
jgi:hypothetical protein